MRELLRSARTSVVLAVCGVLGVIGLIVGFAVPAQAHGNVDDPVARNYRCLGVWQSRFQDPAMAAQDPMCWQAWQADPNAMWNWNGLLRDDDGGRTRELVPDGTICSGGGTVDGRYEALDTPGAWVATPKPTTFAVNLVDQASHGADFIDVYISKDGYDPLTERLAWGDLALVGRTEYVRSGGTVDPKVSGTAYTVDVDATGYPGRRVLMTMWKASHADQTYLLCSDVIIGGADGGGTAAPTPSSTPTLTPVAPTPTITPAPPVSTPSPTPMPTGMDGRPGRCSARFVLNSSWPGGLLGQVFVTAGGSAIDRWHVMWRQPDGQEVVLAWNATHLSHQGMAMFDSASYNGRLNPGETATFGFLGTTQGQAASPEALTCIAG